MNTIIRFFGVIAAVLLTVNIVPGITISGGWTNVFLVALVWSVIALVIKPVLHLLTLPITIVTFGLFALVLNALLFFAMSWVVPGFSVAGFRPAFFGAIALSIITWLIDLAVKGH